MPKKPQKDSLIFYRSFYEAIHELEDEDRLKVYDAICLFGLNHQSIKLDKIPKAIFTLIKPQLEANYKKWIKGYRGKEYGKLGGRPNNPIDNPIPTPIETPKVEGRRNKVEGRKNIDIYTPNPTSINTVKELHPNADIDLLVEDFKDQARNRDKPFKDLDSGFRNYVRKGWVKPVEKTEKSFAQIAHEQPSPWDKDGNVIMLNQKRAIQ